VRNCWGLPLTLSILIDKGHAINRLGISLSSLTFRQVLILLKKPICPFVMTVSVQTSQLEELPTKLMIIVRGTENLINCVPDSILSEAVICVGCSSKVCGFFLRDERVINWMKAAKKIPSINIFLLKHLSPSNIESKPGIIKFLDEPSGKYLAKSRVE